MQIITFKKNLTMKKLVLFLAIVGIALSSCNGKYTIAKRKYNKGFYVSRSSSNKSNDQQIADKKRNIQADLSQTEIVKSTTEKTDKELIDQVKLNDEILISSSSKSDPKIFSNHTNETIALASIQSNHVPMHVNFKKIEISNSKIEHSSKKDSDSDKIIQIILALFPILCLIAVYLHDGKSIKLNFWIDLLLHLTFIGEIIFALLVVLDIIDLN